MDPEQLMNGISKELGDALKSMAKAKSVEEKVQYSLIVKNLTSSLGVFLDLAADMMGYDEDEFS